MRWIVLVAAALISVQANHAKAEEFDIVQSRESFVGLISQRELTRFGIRLTVTPDGAINGRAFGTPVTGAWDWNGGYFCRDLFWGDTDLGFNCQMVQIRESTIRFTSDRGAGNYADLSLQ